MAKAKLIARPTVIVVEENPRLRASIQQTLEKLDFAVLCAYGVSDAMKIAGEHGQELDLAVIDLAVEGEMVAAALRSRYPEMKVVFTSGPSLVPAAPYDALLVKPFVIDAVGVLVTQILGVDRAS